MTQEEKKLIRKIQKDTLFWIVRGLRTQSSTQNYVKELASMTLEATRKPTLGECMDLLYSAAEKFWEANDVFVKNARLYYVLVDQGRLAQGRARLEQNDIDGAVIALRGGEN